MNNNEWITDRLPTEQDADTRGDVYITNKYRRVSEKRWYEVTDQPWMPTNLPEPYLKPKRYEIAKKGPNNYAVIDAINQFARSIAIDWEDDIEGSIVATQIPTLEAAERIAAIYEEVLP